MKSGNLNFLEPSGPLQACNRAAYVVFQYNAILDTSPQTAVNKQRRHMGVWIMKIDTRVRLSQSMWLDGEGGGRKYANSNAVLSEFSVQGNANLGSQN
jgi:hypothetical protein